jgi:hypothetical protein
MSTHDYTYDKITIHISDSAGGTVEDIRDWHVNENGWDDVGYHWIILNGFNRVSGDGEYDSELDGLIQAGRPESKRGIHVKNGNSRNLGICFFALKEEDGGAITVKQKESLIKFILQKCKEHGVPIDEVYGHYELDPERRSFCPCMNMEEFREDLKYIELSTSL